MAQLHVRRSNSDDDTSGPPPRTSGGRTVPVVAGVVLGLVVSFLLRPSVPLTGQLPLGIVLTRGATLRDLDALLIPVAQQSFNYLLAGGVVGGVGGLLFAQFFSRKPGQ